MGTQAFRIPRALIIHPFLCQKTICGTFEVNSDTAVNLSPREWVLLYLVLQRMLDLRPCNGAWADKLGLHRAYVRLMPNDLLTALHYTNAELALLEGTSLFHGTMQRQERVHASSERAKLWLLTVRASTRNYEMQQWLDWIESISWLDAWTWAEDSYASRSFPPQVGGWTSDDEPILIPGFDLLNHRRGEPVTWSYEHEKGKCQNENTGYAVFTWRTAYAEGDQVFNNYGAKTNEELCGSYGFVELGGPDDVLVLALRKSSEQSPRLFYWPRVDPDPPVALMEALRENAKVTPFCSQNDNGGDVARLLGQVDIIETFERMLRQRRKMFRGVQKEVDDAVAFEVGPDRVRARVLHMIREYRMGQAAMLDKGIAWTETQLDKMLDELEKAGWTPPS